MTTATTKKTVEFVSVKVTAKVTEFINEFLSSSKDHDTLILKNGKKVKVWRAGLVRLTMDGQFFGVSHKDKKLVRVVKLEGSMLKTAEMSYNNLVARLRAKK